MSRPLPGLHCEPCGREGEPLTLEVVDALATGEKVDTVGLVQIALQEVVFCRAAHVPVSTSQHHERSVGKSECQFLVWA